MIHYLFLILIVQDGENRHDHKILHTTEDDDIQAAAREYASEFYGDGSHLDDGWWYFRGGSIAVELYSVTELTEYEYNLMKRIFDGDKKRNDYFQIQAAGYNPQLEREEIQIHLGENGNLIIVKTPEGTVVDVYTQDDHLHTMTIWEDDLTPLPDEEPKKWSKEDDKKYNENKQWDDIDPSQRR